MARFRPIGSVVVVVCEGQCNPDLPMYDRTVEEYNSGHSDRLKGYLKDLVRTLKHTPHTIQGGLFWDPKMGFVRRCKCNVCGHIRRW